MFDEFDNDEKLEVIERKHSANNVSQSYVKSSMVDLSKRIDFS